MADHVNVYTCTRVGYHGNLTAPPTISNLHSYILGNTTAVSPSLIVMVTDQPATMPFGDAAGVAPLQASDVGHSWIPALHEELPCPIGTALICGHVFNDALVIV